MIPGRGEPVPDGVVITDDAVITDAGPAAGTDLVLSGGVWKAGRRVKG
jgi:hypothetical protein